MALLIGTVAAISQPKSFTQPKFIPRGPNDYDTAGAKKSMELAEQASGLLANEIDPNTYIVGPNDILTVSVWTSESIHVDVIVSPEGRVVFPRAGVIDVKGLTLAQVQDTVALRAQHIYRNAKTNVSLKRLREFKVFVLGAVAVPSVVPATAADRVFDVLERAGGILDTGSIRGIQLFREGRSTPIIVDLERYMAYGDERGNPTVLGGDRLIVPLRNTKNVIVISGDVVQQSEYQHLEGDSLSTIVKMSGGFLPSARLDSVTVVRISEDGARLITEVYDLSSWDGQLFTGQQLVNDIPLRSGDRVYVRSIPKWNERQQVVIKGEVVYPGRYPLVPNQTRLTDVIGASGGFTDKASLDDAVVFRTSEMKEIDKEYERLSKLPPSEMSTNELQYYRTKSREVKGILSVSFVDIFSKGQLENNPVLKDGDSIYVPEKNLYINITGSVRTPGRIVYMPGRSYLDYIALAGGYGFRADKSATLIIKVKGDQFPAASENYALEPGDNILVLDEPETKFIDVFTEALTITAQLVTIVGVVLTIVRLQ